MPVSMPVSTCYNFLYGFKGAPSARQADRPLAMLAACARHPRKSVSRAPGMTRGYVEWRWGVSPQVAGQPGPSPQRDSAPARAAARRAVTPCPATAHTGRNAPWMTARASWPARSSRGRYESCRAGSPRRRAGTMRFYGSAPPHARAPEDPFYLLRKDHSAESIVGTHPCARSHYRPCRPDGEGQATGQALHSRGETLVEHPGTI
jgi:hypothetical protein